MTVGNVLARGVGKTPRGFTTRITFVGVAAIAVVACGGTSGGGTPSTSGGQDLFNPTNFNTSTVSWLAGNHNASGPPVMGGPLKIEGSTDLSAAGDPQGEYETEGYTVERG